LAGSNHQVKCLKHQPYRFSVAPMMDWVESFLKSNS
jgi:hypothetical protein